MGTADSGSAEEIFIIPKEYRFEILPIATANVHFEATIPFAL